MAGEYIFISIAAGMLGGLTTSLVFRRLEITLIKAIALGLLGGLLVLPVSGLKTGTIWELMEHIAIFGASGGAVSALIFGSTGLASTPSDKLRSSARADKRRWERPRSDSHVFISYRRSDSKEFCDRLHGKLRKVFGSDRTFKDDQLIPVGVDFRNYIEKFIKKSDVMLTVIGPNWAKVKSADGAPRLSKIDDQVRIEIELALTNKLRMINILIDTTPMPDSEQLPYSLHALLEQPHVTIRSGDGFDADVTALIGRLV